MIDLQEALIRLEADLAELDLEWALVGGLAVSARAEPRTTRDLDVAVAVANDREAEKIVNTLRDRGYKVDTVLEQETTGRLATVRLLAPGQPHEGILVDLMFASSGLEPEIVATADAVEVMEGLFVPVATVGHLLALKILAYRPKDLPDIEALLRHATDGDLKNARESLEALSRRGYARNQDLLARFAEAQATLGGKDKRT